MKMAKRTLSMFLALVMALGMLSVITIAAPEDPADYTAVDNAIATALPSVENRYFYTDEANTLIDEVLNNLINRSLTQADQATVDGYVAMVNDLSTLLKKVVTDGSESPLAFNYGAGYSFPYVYPFGTSGAQFMPFRDESKAVNTLGLAASKTTVPAVSTVAGDQNFTVTLSIGSNALNVAGGIPILFDKTKLELVGVNNAGTNVSFTPTRIGTNFAVKYKFSGTLNPGVSTYWPVIYRTDAAFKAQWAGIMLTMTQDSASGSPRCVLPDGQENILTFEFKVKAGAAPGEAVVYIDQAFKRDAMNRQNSLYIGRAKDAESVLTFDTLASYGSTVDTSAARAVVNIVGDATIDFDSAGGTAVAAVSGPVGSAVPAIAPPTKEGYTFDGWLPEIPTEFPADGFTAVAQWTANTYNAVFKVDGAVYETVPTVFGEAIAAPADPVKEGYTFIGWDSVPATMPANDVEINATFDINAYDITFLVDGIEYAVLAADFGFPIPLPADPVKEGYTFTGWDSLPATMPANDITVNATFSVNTYNAVFVVDSAVYATVPTAFGEAIAAPADPVKEGYTFTGWDPAPGTMGAADQTFNALFTINTYNAVFMVDGAQYEIVPTVYGATIALPADPAKAGYNFIGWDPLPGTMGAADETFNAVFSPISDVLSVTNTSDYYVGTRTVFTVVVKGSPAKIQFGLKANPSVTWTWNRTHVDVLSITPTFVDYEGTGVIGDNNCEIWEIRMTVNYDLADMTARAKYGMVFNQNYFDFVMECAEPVFDNGIYDVQIDYDKFVRGATSVITVKTGLDAVKIRLVSTAGTLTFSKTYTPTEARDGYLYWTITLKFTTLGDNAFTVRSCGKDLIWHDYATPLTFTVYRYELPVDTGRGIISADIPGRVLQGIAAEATVTTELGCNQIRLTGSNGDVLVFDASNAAVAEVDGALVWTIQPVFNFLGDNTYTVSGRFGLSTVVALDGSFNVTVLY